MGEGGSGSQKVKGKRKFYHATVRMSIGDMEFPPIPTNGKTGHGNSRNFFFFITINQSFLEACSRPNAELSKGINPRSLFDLNIDNDWASVVEIHGTLHE